MRKLLSVVILIVCVVPAVFYAQSPNTQLTGKLKGLVKDSTSHRMPAVKIIVKDVKLNTRREFQSDENGNFKAELPAGAYKISAEKEGYRSPTLKVVGVAARATVTVEIIFPPVYTNEDPNPTRD